MKDTKQNFIEEGIKNLLFNAVKANAGEELLIIGEKGNKAHFDNRVCDVVAQVANDAQLNTKIIISDVGNSADEFPEQISQAMRTADHTVFFSRLGDQIRFCSTPGIGTKTMCYTLDCDYLASDFCRCPHQLNQQLYDRLVDKISRAKNYKITCALGTDLSGNLVDTPNSSNGEMLFTQFTVNLFPLTIFEPVSCSQMSGKLVIKDWVTSSSTIIYEDSILFVSKPVTATVLNGMITHFDGDKDQCDKLEKHFLRVAEIVGGEAMQVNSWHTGIIPATWYKDRADDDLDKWGSVSFASPRVTHFHACGDDPGQIAFNLFDTTIRFDDQVIWKNGNYMLPISNECDDIFIGQSQWRSVYEKNGDIGISY